MINYLSYMKTLKECSIDNSDNNIKYIVNSDKYAFSLDVFFVDFFKRKNIDRVKSLDAIYSKYRDFSHKNVFIEFKNQKIRNIKFDELYAKIFNSIIVFISENCYTIEKPAVDNEFLLVYNNDLEKIRCYISEYANRSDKFKGIEKFKNYLFSDVLKITSDEFDDYIKNFDYRT